MKAKFGLLILSLSTLTSICSAASIPCTNNTCPKGYVVQFSGINMLHATCSCLKVRDLDNYQNEKAKLCTKEIQQCKDGDSASCAFLADELGPGCPAKDVIDFCKEEKIINSYFCDQMNNKLKSALTDKVKAEKQQNCYYTARRCMSEPMEGYCEEIETSCTSEIIAATCEDPKNQYNSFFKTFEEDMCIDAIKKARADNGHYYLCKNVKDNCLESNPGCILAEENCDIFTIAELCSENKIKDASICDNAISETKRLEEIARTPVTRTKCDDAKLLCSPADIPSCLNVYTYCEKEVIKGMCNTFAWLRPYVICRNL